MDEQVSRPITPDAAPRVTPGSDRAPAGRGTASSTGWKWVVGIVVALFLVLFACSGLAVVSMLGPDSGPSRGSGDAVALLHLDGVIAGTGSIYSGIVTPEYFVDQLQQAEADPRVKAILIRVDSPGGTVAASQEIAIETARIDKPIVVSVGDVAASGAYMVASQCDEIIAAPTSSVGSIGVIAQIPNVAGLLDTLGIEFTVLTSGEYKDAGSPYRSLTATETALFEQHLDFAYREFISIVAEGRGMPESEVEQMANGWIWPGAVAEEMGLVDATGTFNDALDRAAELGGIEGEPRIISYREPDLSWLFQSLIGLTSPMDRLGGSALEGDTLRQSLPR